MPRTSLVLTGVLIITCALLAGGCGSNESIQDESSSTTADASAAESVDGEDSESRSASAGTAAAEAPPDEASDNGGGAESDPDGAPSAPEDTRGTALDGALVDAAAQVVETPSPEIDEEPLDELSADDPYQPRTSPAGLSITRAYICRGIEESEPTDAGRSFLPKEDGLNRLCCFSEIAGAAGPDSIWHVWYWGEREMGRVGLEVKSSRWRTWSRKQVLDEWKGEWHVDVIDASGFLLYRLEFSIE